MITPELRADIRRKYFGEHWKVGTIAETLGVHHETVRRAVGLETTLRAAQVARGSILDAYKPFILEQLELYPRLVGTRVHAMIKSRGFAGSIYPVRAFVREVRPRPRSEAFFRLSVLPGEQAQVDWASFGTIQVGNAVRALSCFVMVLSYSRAMYARFVLDMTMESFLRCHEAAFESFGGTSRRVLYDNLKTAVLERIGDAIRFHPRLLEFAGHYHFEPVPCAKARGNEKGRVERSIRYLRESFFAARRYRDLDDLNRQLDAWVETVADARVMRDDDAQRPVSDVFAEERDRLMPLPKNRFEVRLVRPVRSGKTPYVRYDKNDYSIPHTLIRKPLTLVADESEIRILDGEHEVARHARSYERHRQIESEVHLAELAQSKAKARHARGRNRLFAGAPNAERFLGYVAIHGGHLGGTTTRLLKLLEAYGAKELDDAIAEAIATTSFSARSVTFLLEQRRRAANRTMLAPVDLPDDPRVRRLIVTTRSLSSFDVLSDDTGRGGES